MKQCNVKAIPNENNLPKYFWVEAVNTTYYIMNRVLLRLIRTKLHLNYSMIGNKKSANFMVFAYKRLLLNNKEPLHKADEGIFMGYSTPSKTYRVYNKKNGC